MGQCFNIDTRHLIQDWLLKNLEAVKQCGLPIDLFQIDDGYGLIMPELLCVEWIFPIGEILIGHV